MAPGIDVMTLLYHCLQRVRLSQRRAMCVCVYLKVLNQSTPFIPTDEWQDIKGRHVPGRLHYSFEIRGNYAKKIFKEGSNSAHKIQTSKLSADDAHPSYPKLDELGKQVLTKCKNCNKEYVNI